MFSSENWFGASAGFYNGVATQSLRFEDGDSPYLEFDPASSTAGTWTMSFWVKRANLGASYAIFSSGIVDARGHLLFNSDDQLQLQPFNSSGQAGYTKTDMKFRDVSAWYHIVISANGITTSNIATNLIIYVNGVVATRSFNQGSSASGGDRLGDTQAKRIGEFAPDSGSHFDGYLCDFNFVDGTVKDQNDFGEFKNGVWIAKEPDVSDYGAGGWRLQFNQTGTGTASASTIGADTSGQTNHWTSSGIVASDCNMPDSPENNFCTWNPLTIGSQGTLSEGNLKNASFYTSDLSGNASTFFPESGKWYWELRVDVGGTYPYIGITSQEKTNATVAGGTNYSIAWRVNGTGATLGSSLGTITKENIPSFADDDIISFALDVDARKIWVAKNNTYADSGDPANGTGQNASWTLDVGISPFISGYQSQGVGTIANFGQDDTYAGAISSAGNTDGNGKGVFKYAQPSGYLALCTSNLTEPTISPNADTQADDYFNAVLYTGNGSTQSITGVGFQPDWVWIKGRSFGSNNRVTDSSRGASKGLKINGTDAEDTSSTYYATAFGSDGFSLNSGAGDVNQNNETFVAWNWLANGGTTSSNTDGSITSTVQANTTAGFSIVTYTGSTSESVGHGLGVAPKMIMVKDRDATSSWAVYHQSVQNATSNGFLELNSTSATQTGSNPRFLSGTAGTSQPTSTVFYVNNYSGSSTNNTGNDYVAYCFAEVEGYSRFGNYIPNGNNDGTFVFTGFEISFLMIKRAVGGTGVYSSWAMYDNKRKTINSDVGTDSNPLFANKSSQEGIRGNGSLSISGTRTAIDFLSNGFKLRDVANEIGVSGNTYIYMAFAKNPFKYSTAQ